MNNHETSSETRSTTILTVRRDDTVSVGGDGQVTMNETVVKERASKLRRLYHDEVMVGFAGSAGDAFALLERFSGQLEEYQGNLIRSAHELAKEWRTDKMLRPLESLMIAADQDHTLLISGNGEVIEPDDGILGIGSGGNYAAAAARALIENTDLGAEEIVRKSLNIAANICVYTNREICIETLPPRKA
ncbi:MAG: ATP-dependent protease subunit HslV [Planctomycetota bacterium]